MNDALPKNAVVTVCIVTTYKPEQLERCLKSLCPASQRAPILVYVIDNATDYNVPEIVRQTYPGAQIIRNDTRRGLTYNRNFVLKQCRTEYFMTLDDDVELGGNCLDLMYEFMEAHPESGQAGAALYEKSWLAEPVPCGYKITPFPYPLRVCLVDILKHAGLAGWVMKKARRQRHYQTAQQNEALEVAGVIGACSLTRTGVIRKVGFLDEGYPIYFDDLDFSTRLRRAGWRCYQAPGARLIHYVSSSYNPQTKRNVARGCLRFARKFYAYPTFAATFALAGMLYFIKFLKERLY